MQHSTTSIIEEDENSDNDQHDYDRLQFDISRRTDTNLIKDQNEQFSQIASTKANDSSSWHISRYLLNFISISPDMLAEAEERLYRNLKRKYYGEYVRIRGDDLIWTVKSINATPNPTPIVLIHDFGCATGIWIQNIDFLSTRHPLYMFDLLGFGRSSRPNFDQTNMISAETKFVESIEDWRIAVGLETGFYLIGHGFGAYLATLYTLRYSTYVKKLILLDPWGFNPKPDESQLSINTPRWISLIAYVVESWTSFSAFRYLGPLGLPLLKLLAPRWKRLAPIDPSNQISNALYEYLYYANTQPASGDLGFQTLASWYGWAKNPIVQAGHSRIESLSREISLAFIYGSRTSIDNTAAHQILHERNSTNTFIKTIHNAAHYFFMEKPIQFHEVMSELLSDLPHNFRTLASGDRAITTTILSE